GDPGRVDPAHLAGADAEGLPVAAEDDRVGLDELGYAPGEQHVGKLGFGRGDLSDYPQFLGREVARVERLHQQAAADPLEVEGIAARRQRNLEQADVLLGGEDGARAVGEARGDQYLDELVG